MSNNLIIPEYVIELNEDYTISNHGIHKHVCNYYINQRKTHNKYKVQYGGGINQDDIIRKYFTSSALRYLQLNDVTSSEMFSFITGQYQNKPSHTTPTQYGGARKYKNNKNKNNKNQNKNNRNRQTDVLDVLACGAAGCDDAKVRQMDHASRHCARPSRWVI